MASMEAVGWFTVGPNVRIPPKIIFIRLVKMTDPTYAYNSFTKFEYEVYARKRNSCHSVKT
jgi:hypothetical protein